MVVSKASNCFLNFEMFLFHDSVVYYDIVVLWI